MEKMIRVYNNNNFNIGVKLWDGREQVINAHSFIPMSEDNIAYISGISTLFSSGHLRIGTPEEEDRVLESIGVVKEDNTNFMDDVEIKKGLSKAASKLGEWIDSLDKDPVLMDRVVSIAKSMDLPTSKMKILKQKIPQMNSDVDE